MKVNRKESSNHPCRAQMGGTPTSHVAWVWESSRRMVCASCILRRSRDSLSKNQHRPSLVQRCCCKCNVMHARLSPVNHEACSTFEMASSSSSRCTRHRTSAEMQSSWYPNEDFGKGYERFVRSSTILVWNGESNESLFGLPKSSFWGSIKVTRKKYP